jgi:DNA-binding CsgD family transcriptional regulator
LAVEELLREWSRKEDAHPTAEALVRVGGPSSVPVLTAVVHEQVSDLDRDTLMVLSVVALMPQPASETVARSIARFGVDRFNIALEEALASGFLTRTGPTGLRFRHELQREVFQDQMGMSERRSLHRRIAAVLVKSEQYPAAEVANQFVGAGRMDQAREWLEQASIEAARAHDHGNAMNHLAAALDLCPQEEAEVRTRLAERVVVAARSSNKPAAGIELVEQALSSTSDAAHRGRLFLCLARLVSFFGDYESRVTALNEARQAFSAAANNVGLARALGELALPVGKTPSIAERIALGREGLALAETTGDPSAIGLCAANLAVAELRSGNPSAFELWARSVSVHGPDKSSDRGEEAVRNRTNWAIGALDYGLYPEADRVIRDGAQLWDNPFWKEFFHCLKAISLWRVGRWDDAEEEAALARTGISRPEVGATCTAIQAAIAFERDAHPDIRPLTGAAKSLVELSDEQWGSLAHSILMRIRAARREPQPERGLSRLVQLIMATGVRIGWDDLLPAIAEMNPTLCRHTLAVLGDVRPMGKRAEASLLYMDGLLALDQHGKDAHPLLVEAARQFEGLPDPYFTAKALEAASEARLQTRERDGELRVRAAEIYRDLGADRSLAQLLRRFRSSRALDGFRTPPSQAHAGSPGLTPREREVANLARQGYTARAIAEILAISMPTTKKHLERVKSKLSVERKSDLVRLLSADL